MFTMSLVALSDERKRRFERIFRGALSDTERTLDQGAREAAKNISQFRRILAGVERHLDALTMQEDEFWRAVCERLVMEFGFSKRIRRVSKLRRLTIGTKRQLRLTARKVQRTA